MKMSKLSNQTNSQDPQAVNSRVFVGNLNTFQCSKTDVERMFQRYGRLAGISMHKGYAFVQFTNPFDARNACLGEDGRNILSQTLDVNMVAEPKSHQIGRSRQNVNKTGNDWEYYYDSYYTSTLFPSSPRPMKRPRLQQQQVLAPSGRLINGIPNQANGHQQQQQQSSPLHNGHHHHSHINGAQASNGGGLMGDEGHPSYIMANFFQNGSAPSLNGHPHLHPPPSVPSLSFKVYSNPDVLICGNCRECFSEITELLDHKRTYCKLRFACKCQQSNGNCGGGGNAVATTPPTTAQTAGATAAEASSLSTKNPSPAVAPSLNTLGTTATASARLLCVVCKSVFQSPWDLMEHVQAAHMINIYELGSSQAPATELSNENDKKSSLAETDSNTKVPFTTGSPLDSGHSPVSKEDHHGTLLSCQVHQPQENGSSMEAPGGTPHANIAKNCSTTTPPLALQDDDLRLFDDLENASSSSPISQIEMEGGADKLSNDTALLAFTCPVSSTPNVAVRGALSIVSSL